MVLTGVLGAFAAGALATQLPPPMPAPPRQVMAEPEPMPEPPVAEAQPEVTREEVGNALADWCSEPRNAPTPLCRKMGRTQH